jgi:WD40 repeat protein
LDAPPGRVHRPPAWSVTFNPSLTRLVSASMSVSDSQGAVVLWDLRTGKEAFAFDGGMLAQFADDGNTLVSAQPDLFNASFLKFRRAAP